MEDAVTNIPKENEAPNPKLETLENPGILNPKPQLPNGKSATPNPRPKISYPKP